jgi:transcription initiation factor IIE alpha subunit
MKSKTRCPQCRCLFVPQGVPSVPKVVVVCGSKRALAILQFVCQEGDATDDEIDTHFRWGHQTTSASTSALRRNGLLAFTDLRRKTRKGCLAYANVLTPRAWKVLKRSR